MKGKRLLQEIAKKLHIPGRCKMTEVELEQAIENTSKIYLKEILNNNIIEDGFIIKEILNNKLIRCKNCIEELKKQEKIDQYTYDKMVMKDTIRELSWRYITKDKCFCTRIMVDGEITACIDCGLVLEDSEVDRSGDYYPHKIKAKTA